MAKTIISSELCKQALKPTVHLSHQGSAKDGPIETDRNRYRTKPTWDSPDVSLTVRSMFLSLWGTKEGKRLSKSPQERRKLYDE